MGGTLEELKKALRNIPRASDGEVCLFRSPELPAFAGVVGMTFEVALSNSIVSTI
jgi:hypothetical protein